MIGGDVRHPRFVTFEGVDGAGKSTHVGWFADALRTASGADVVLTREPGGTPLGESLRSLLLHEEMDLETEVLLVFGARANHLARVIRPALARGAFVVCDRFTDATVAYQGGGRGLARERIERLRRFVHPDVEPATTILFDLDPAVARGRLEGTRDLDRFERERVDFFDRVRSAYRELAAAEPERFHVVDGAERVDTIRTKLEELVSTLCS